MVLFLGIGPPFVNPGDCASGQHLDSHWDGHRKSGQRPCRSAVYFTSRGCVRCVGDGVGRLSRRRPSHRKVSFYFPFLKSFWGKLYFFLKKKGMVSYVYVLLSMLVAKRELTPCYRDAYSVDTLGGHYGRKAG